MHGLLGGGTQNGISDLLLLILLLGSSFFPGVRSVRRSVDYWSGFGCQPGENSRRECHGYQYGHGVRTSTISNDTGAYNFPSLAVGPYQLEATLTGFRTARVANIDLRSNQTLRYNLTMEIASVALASRSRLMRKEFWPSPRRASAGSVAGSGVRTALDRRRRARPGQHSSRLPFGRRGPGANSDTMAGASSSTINTVRDGLSVTDGRFPNGAFATTVLNPDMVGEVKLILTPVDAEMGRGQRTGADYDPLGNQPLQRRRGWSIVTAP
jgi:hypothetical protein